MKKSQQKRARKLAKRPAPKARGRGGRAGGIMANTWRAGTPSTSSNSDGDVALATMLVGALAARRR